MLFYNHSSLTFGRRNRDIAEIFLPGFSATAFVDALADVYNGVSRKLILFDK